MDLNKNNYYAAETAASEQEQLRKTRPDDARTNCTASYVRANWGSSEAVDLWFQKGIYGTTSRHTLNVSLGFCIKLNLRLRTTSAPTRLEALRGEPRQRLKLCSYESVQLRDRFSQGERRGGRIVILRSYGISWFPCGVSPTSSF